MSQITRGKDLHHIGLAEKDLEERVIIGIGWIEGEMLPPHRYCRKRDVTRVLEYLHDKRFRTAPDSLHGEEIRRRFRTVPKLVELVGAFAHGCVAVTAHYLIESGSMVYVNPELILLPRRQHYPPYWIGRIFMEQMLSKQPARRCHVYGGNFIFYDVAHREKTYRHNGSS